MKFFQIFCFTLSRLPNPFLFSTLKKKQKCLCASVLAGMCLSSFKRLTSAPGSGPAGVGRPLGPRLRPPAGRGAGKPSSSCGLSPCSLLLPGSELCGFPLLWLIKASTSHCLGPARPQRTVFSFSTHVKKCRIFLKYKRVRLSLKGVYRRPAT